VLTVRRGFVAYHANTYPVGTPVEAIPAGRPVGMESRSPWNRPLSPLPAGFNGNGRSVADLNDSNGTIQYAYWPDGTGPYSERHTRYLTEKHGGWYAHPSFAPSFPTLRFDGDQYYIQFRCYISASRWEGSMATRSAKLLWLGSYTGFYTPLHELMMMTSDSTSPNATIGPQMPFYYTAQSPGIYIPHTAQAPYGYPAQPGLSGPNVDPPTCVCGPTNGVVGTYNGCWKYPTNEWFTVMVRVKPGTQNSRVNNTFIYDHPDSEMTVKVANRGDTQWTTIFDGSFCLWFGYTGGQWNNFPSNSAPGFNAFNPTCYWNILIGDIVPDRPVQTKFAQIICSTQPIPLPT